MKSCERSEALRDYAFDELPAPERPGMERHIAACESCEAELRALQLTTTILRAIPDREVPQRIAFVSDKIFEPSPLARFFSRFTWSGLPGFASACVLAGAIIFSASLISGNRPAAAPTVISQATVQDVSQQLDAAVRKAVAQVREEDARRAQTALASAELRHQEEHKALLVSMQESMDVMQKRMGAYTSLASLETPINGGGQ